MQQGVFSNEGRGRWIPEKGRGVFRWGVESQASFDVWKPFPYLDAAEMLAFSADRQDLTHPDNARGTNVLGQEGMYLTDLLQFLH